MTIIDKETWPRRAHYDFFAPMSDPFYTLTFPVDVTPLRAWCRANAMPFYRPRSTGLVTVRWSQKELLHTIARMMGQSLTDNYRVNGQYIEQEGAMVFDLNEAYRVEASSAPVRR